MAAGGNSFNDFAENQLTTFPAGFHPAGCFRHGLSRFNDVRRLARETSIIKAGDKEKKAFPLRSKPLESS